MNDRLEYIKRVMKQLKQDMNDFGATEEDKTRMKNYKKEIEIIEQGELHLKMCIGCGCDIIRGTEKCEDCKKLSGCCNEKIEDNHCLSCMCEIEE